MAEFFTFLFVGGFLIAICSVGIMAALGIIAAVGAAHAYVIDRTGN